MRKKIASIFKDLLILDINNIKVSILNRKKLFSRISKYAIIIINTYKKRFFHIINSGIIKTIRIRLIKGFYKKYDDINLMVNIGGGNFFRKHWRVLDYPSPNYKFKKFEIDYIFDLTSNKALPFKSNSVKLFYSSHTLEHIPQEFCQHIFDELNRCLCQGGAVRITVPDFDKAYDAYMKNNFDFFRKYNGDNLKEKFLNFFATYFMKKIPIEEFNRNFEKMNKTEFADYYTKQIPRESQLLNGGYHINWWNFEKLKAALSNSGFKEIYRTGNQGSRFKEMRGKGRRKGFDSTHPELSINIEAIKV